MSQMDKTEQPTKHKIHKAKQLGQVARSKELINVMSLIISLIIISALYKSHFKSIKYLLFRCFLLSGHFNLNAANFNELVNSILSKLLTLFLPIGLGITLTILLTSLTQTGFIWSAKALKINFKRLNIMQSLSRYFSSQFVFDGIKNCMKLLILCALSSGYIFHKIPHLNLFIKKNPIQYPNELMTHLLGAGYLICAVLFGISFIDLLFARWKYKKEQRMTKQEVKEEFKQHEGCPKIKAKIKQNQHEMRIRLRSLHKIKEADVLITNPSHLAIALQYKRHTMPAPKILCKVQGDMVEKAKQLARRHGVAIIEHKPFAQALFKNVALNQYIDESLFPFAASIYQTIYMSNKKEVSS